MHDAMTSACVRPGGLRPPPSPPIWPLWPWMTPASPPSGKAAGTALRTLLAPPCLWPRRGRIGRPKSPAASRSMSCLASCAPTTRLCNWPTADSWNRTTSLPCKCGWPAMSSRHLPRKIRRRTCSPPIPSRLGDISTDRDSDGVLRRVKCFNLNWHPAFKSHGPSGGGRFGACPHRTESDYSAAARHQPHRQAGPRWQFRFGPLCGRKDPAPAEAF